tara:strand:+ start:19601 stop:19855 length:255 start_codon:yes stop_codon:yes gene_type:complete
MTEQEACDRRTYESFAHDVQMLQGIEKFLSLMENLESEETEPNQELLENLDDWALYLWSEWTCCKDRMRELEEKYPNWKQEIDD